MSSKPPSALEPSGCANADILRGGVIEFGGADAGAFAQAQLMNDVRLLSDLQWQWTGWLTAKGRVVALGALLRLSADQFWLLLPDYPASTLRDALQGFVFRSKVKLIVRTDVASRAAEPSAPIAPDPRFAVREGDVIQMDWSGERARTLLVGGPDGLPASESYAAQAWAVDDLAHGLPRLDPAAEPAYTPQMLGLARLNAYSVKKGCYPGQEIVARTHFLGKAKRGLHRLRCAVPMQRNQMLLGADGAVGEVLCAASLGERHEAQAVLAQSALATPDSLHLQRPDASIRDTIHVIDFAQGLAR